MFGGSAASVTDSGTKLNYLRVDFLRGISGNIKSRTIIFQGHVRAIYGPVDAWQQELFANGPGGIPAGAVTLESEELQVNEDPIAHRIAATQPGAPAAGPFELKATGNVRIEGGDAAQGRFNATAHSASYNQDKAVFILEGNGQLSAMLHLTGKDGITGAPAAGKITYYRETGRVKVDNLRATPVTFPGQGGRQATRP
jgi:lipopolysaccharide export system protein LptA